MKRVQVAYKDTCGVNSEELGRAGSQLALEIERMDAGDYAFTALPADMAMHERVDAVVAEKKALNPTALVVVGIGGSNLGTMAVQQAVYGTFYNEQQPEVSVYYADTVDADHTADIILLLEQKLQASESVIVAIVSKSGTTTETVANAQLFIDLLARYQGQAHTRSIVAITDEGSKLWALAQEKGFSRLAIPKDVGGRYSVFSPVGLFPLGLLGVDTKALCAGAQAMLDSCTASFADNPAALSAAVLATLYESGHTIHDTFLFSSDLEGVGKWYRQLLGESIGKEHDRDGKLVRVGITPTVSMGSTDLHSVGQLYLGGPRDKVTTFITVAQNKTELMAPAIQGKSFHAIMDAILRGTQAAYKNNGIPFMICVLPDKNAASIGQLLQWQLCQMVYLGYLLNVNPFDQPNVELYKKETRKILTHE